MEDEINDECEKVEQKDKEAYENIRTTDLNLNLHIRNSRYHHRLKITKNHEESFLKGSNSIYLRIYSEYHDLIIKSGTAGI